MKRGDAAREAVKNKIIEAFGNDYVAFVDKKIYVEAEDGPGGERIQFAIAMTMPKTTVAASKSGGVSNSNTDWSGPMAAEQPRTEISDEDKKKVEELMKSLGLD